MVHLCAMVICAVHAANEIETMLYFYNCLCGNLMFNLLPVSGFIFTYYFLVSLCALN